MVQCNAIGSNGKRCKNDAIEGSEYCHFEAHQKQELDPYAQLSDLRKRFVDEYLIDCNQSRAARDAGYSEKTCGQIGWQILREPKVRQAIDYRLAEMKITSEEAIKQLSDMSRGNLANFMEWDADTQTLKVQLGTEEARRSFHTIKKLEQRDIVVKSATLDDPDEIISRTFKIELHDAKDAIDKILKLYGSYAPLQVDVKNFDMSKLNDIQLERLAKGEPLELILATSGESGT